MPTHATFEHWLQSRLTAHGFATGGIDGKIGPNTLAALKAFQRARGLPVSGGADTATVGALRQSASAGAVAPVDRDEALLAQTSGPAVFPRQKDVMDYFGPVGKNQVLVPVPWTMRLAWDKRRMVSRISLHEKVADSAAGAFEEIKREYGEDGIKHIGADLFGGSLNVRRMRGGSAWSMHSWGIAIDFDPERNALKTRAPHARLSKADCVAFWLAWEKRGWVSLGRARNFDWMHVQAARL